MADYITGIITPSDRSGWVKLRTLVLLRWLAVAGQIGAVVIAYTLFDIDLRIDLCIATIGASIAFNIISLTISSANYRLSERNASLVLIFDLSQLAFLLYLTGGLSNPFAVLMLVPVTIAAATMTTRATVLLGMVSIAFVTALLFVFQPLTTRLGTLIELPVLLQYGAWAALLVAIIFLAAYTKRVTQDSFSMSQALNATHLALVREQRLSALSGVVAAAAHELGTPLATIKLVAAELADELSDNAELREDAELISSQADRCRDIMRDMGDAGKDDMLLHYAPISAVVEEAAEPHLKRGKKIIIRVDGVVSGPSIANQPEIIRMAEIVHGLRNLIQNAVDFSRSTVWIDIGWDDKMLLIHVGDDGPGYPVDLIGKIGDPFVKKRSRSAAPAPDFSRPGYEGMGLGLFIAKTLLERSGARLTFANGSPRNTQKNSQTTQAPELASPSGAIVELVWKRSDIEADKATTRGPLGFNQPISG